MTDSESSAFDPLGSQEPPEEEKYPVRIQISHKVAAEIGYQDARVIIKVRTGIPLVGEIPLTLDMEDIPAVEKVVNFAKDWAARPEMERFFKGAK